ncbi:MAG: hypothetical protein FWG75_00030 [Cystobacterineae bacterium]|nr:hypothetical protein [Cystobacterineae bacterium]
MSKESSELFVELQKAWEGAQRQLAVLRKQVQQRATLERFWEEKEQAERKHLQALSDLGLAIYEEIQQGIITPQKRWESLLQRIADALQKNQEQHQKLSELLDEGQALASQKKEPGP